MHFLCGNCRCCIVILGLDPCWIASNGWQWKKDKKGERCQREDTWLKLPPWSCFLPLHLSTHWQGSSYPVVIFHCADLAPFTEHLYNLSSCLCLDLLWKCVNNPTSTDASLFNVEYHWAKGRSVAQDDTWECNAFEKGSAEGKIALDLPLTSGSLSSVSLWKDTKINSALIFVPHPSGSH